MAQIVILDEHPIKLSARGEWSHGSQPLHPRVASLFTRNIVPHADGTYWVELGPSRHVIELEDGAAFWARTVLLERDAAGLLQAAQVVCCDERREPLAFDTLMQAPDGRFYCRIVRHGLRVPCRLKPADYHTLALFAEMVGDTACVVAAGKQYPIRPFDAAVVSTPPH